MSDAEFSEEIPETIATYLRLRGLKPGPRSRSRRRRRTDDDNEPFAPGRDPHGLGDVLTNLTRDAGWDARLSEEDLLLDWTAVAGEGTAQHAQPVALGDGVLTIRCDSTAWAKQLQIMRADILSRILDHHPDAGIHTLRFIGPDVPSWKFGRRTIPGRGPRDTYG